MTKVIHLHLHNKEELGAINAKVVLVQLNKSGKQIILPQMEKMTGDKSKPREDRQ